MLSTLGKTTTLGLTTFDFHLVWRQYLYIILHVGKISLNSSRKDNIRIIITHLGINSSSLFNNKIINKITQ
jgi:hypothetical protein